MAPSRTERRAGAFGARARPFLASFAHDHPGDAQITHIRAARGETYYQAALADPAQFIFIGETPLGAPVGYALLTPPDLPIETDVTKDIEIKRFYLLCGWQGGGPGDALPDGSSDRGGRPAGRTAAFAGRLFAERPGAALL